MRVNAVSRWLRAGGIAFAVLALAASAVEVSREGRESVAPAPVGAARDPFEIELERCNTLMPTSARDDSCERAWAENRRRFIGASRHGSTITAATSAQPATAGERP